MLGPAAQVLESELGVAVMICPRLVPGPAPNLLVPSLFRLTSWVVTSSFPLTKATSDGPAYSAGMTTGSVTTEGRPDRTVVTAPAVVTRAVTPGVPRQLVGDW